jgi:hypothetical protein
MWTWVHREEEIIGTEVIVEIAPGDAGLESYVQIVGT